MNKPSLALTQEARNIGEINTGAKSVCAVTVTYGDRQRLVRQVVAALLGQDAIVKVVVVSNAACWSVKTLGEELGPERVEVVELKANRGAGAGFSAGIKRACELGAELVWLIDDDNQPQKDALPELLEAYSRLNHDFPKDKLAVLAFRPNHLEAAAAGWRLKRRPSSFWGFHVVDIPCKLWRKTPWGRPGMPKKLPALVEMMDGPYGGLLFHRAVIEKHGLPREDFVLYADDTEFTYRITRDGGALRLVTSAALIDLESSFHHAERCFWGSLQYGLGRSSDLRTFYDARNRAYMDSHCLPHNRLMLWINRQVYCFTLRFLASAFHSTDRYRLLKRAIADGLEGRLGMHPEYPL